MLQRQVSQQAVSSAEAEQLVRLQYDQCKLVLDAEDFVDLNIRELVSTKNNRLRVKNNGRSAYAKKIVPYYTSESRDFLLAHGNCIEAMPEFNFKFDMIFADPPYFLSNGGISFQSGKVVCVDKGDWDKSITPKEINDFNMQWLSLCRDKLKENGTIWVSGTYHNIFSVANCLTSLGYKILNVITWQKTNPPINISCRFFTYSTEFIIWARKNPKIPHKFNYKLMKQLNDDKQMTDVWRLPAIGRWEKSQGKHPTQKPLSLLTRIILASSEPGDWIFDPFSGSSTTGIAANLIERRFAGIEQEKEFCIMSKDRREEINSADFRKFLINHIVDLKNKVNVSVPSEVNEQVIDYYSPIPFE